MYKIKAATQFALLFFSIGTLLFLVQLLVGQLSMITFIGYYFVMLAILINVLMLTIQFLILVFKNDKMMTLKSIGILLINIPIAYLYYYTILNYII